jgi:aminopeptidase-like protein
MHDTTKSPEIDAIGEKIYALLHDLYPICRSITGNGVRETLERIRQQIPIGVHEVPSGTRVFDWTVPREWNINDAYVITPTGEKIAEFRKHNLHILNYSVPVHKKVTLDELKQHLFTLPDHPDWIPYRTSYYKDAWGFCISHNQLQSLPKGEYEVFIDSTLEPGHLTYGELFIQGETNEEVLFSCHVCHPSLCNDNLSGIALATHLADYLDNRQLRYSYRFLFIPGTIGSITWLALNEDKTSNIKHGFVVTCVGDGGPFSYKKSRRASAEIDRAVFHVLSHSREGFREIDFYPYGYDERQYCSPGFNLAVGSLSRSSHGQFPEYHTSADNLELVKPQYLKESFDTFIDVIDVIENNSAYINLNPKCEPQLGRRGLYSNVGAPSGSRVKEMALLWVLNLSDGQHDLLAIAERSGEVFSDIQNAAQALLSSGLLKEITGNPVA